MSFIILVCLIYFLLFYEILLNSFFHAYEIDVHLTLKINLYFYKLLE